MDAFSFVSVYAVIGCAISIFILIHWMRVNYPSPGETAAGIIAFVAVIALGALGIFFNHPQFGDDPEIGYQDKATYGLVPLSELDYSDEELRGNNGNSSVYVYCYDVDGYNDDCYYLAVPKANDGSGYRLVRILRSATTVEEADGEAPSITIREKTVTNKGFLDHVSEAIGYEYVLRVDDASMASGTRFDLYYSSNKLEE